MIHQPLYNIMICKTLTHLTFQMLLRWHQSQSLRPVFHDHTNNGNRIHQHHFLRDNMV